MKTFKILGLMLSYPKPEMISHLDELIEVLEAEAILPQKNIKKIRALATEMQEGDIYEVQENFVDLFDRGRAHCLHLFEHIHGESRDRGQAMVNLVETYETKGLYLQKGELPDYLPLFLEYLSLCAPEEAFALLGDPITVIASIGVKLKKRGANYACLFEALKVLSKVKPDAEMIKSAEAEPLEEFSHEEMDKDWEEAAAFDNTDVDQADCNSCDVFSGAVAEMSKGTPLENQANQKGVE